MTGSFFKKIATLSSSVILVVLFLLYRVGFFDKPETYNTSLLPSDNNAADQRPSNGDTAKPGIDSAHHLMFSSSKSIILSDKSRSVKDSTKRNSPVLQKKESTLFSSSKSAIIIEPGKRYGFRRDTMKLKVGIPDSTKRSNQ